jgi:hypothetical protein
VNILDENLTRNQRELLEAWRIPVKQIGFNIGHSGMQDGEIMPLLIGRRRSTFFTRDDDFYDARLCHRSVCLVYLAVNMNEAAAFVRRFLRHPDFRIYSKRLGKVIRVSNRGISFWEINDARHRRVDWK